MIDTQKKHKALQGMMCFLFFITLSTLSINAQTDTSRVYRNLILMDSILTEKYNNVNIDTNYIQRPSERFTLKARVNISGASIETIGQLDGDIFHTKAEADIKNTLSIAATYRGITLGAAINPALIAGRYKDYELNINSYGNRFGGEVIYQRAKNFKGHIEMNDSYIVDLPNNILTVQTLNLNGYYVLNNKRFSYPAAFTQSYIQRRSAGSVIIGASLHAQDLENDTEKLNNTLATHLKTVNVGVGCGYGYNFVLRHNWLIHISSLPTFIVYGYRRMYIDNEQQTMDYSFPEVIITARGAVVHSWKKYFVGATMVYNYSKTGQQERLEISNTKWRIRTFWGIRL